MSNILVHAGLMLWLLRLAGLALVVITALLFVLKAPESKRRSVITGTSLPGIAVELVAIVLSLGHWFAVLVQGALMAALVTMLVLAGDDKGRS